MARRKPKNAPPSIGAFVPVIPDQVVVNVDAISGYEAEQLKSLIAEQHRRSCEALKLYEVVSEKCEEFHRGLNKTGDARAKIRLAIGSNQSGKTTTACVEFARAVTGQDPHSKYPKEGKAFVFGLTEKHLGDPIYEKLFRAGSFKVIRDQQTGLWRAYHGVHDAHRANEAKPSPPLIPKRFVRQISWKKKRERIPAMIEFTTGWVAYFFSAEGAIPQGQTIDLWWIDEEPGRDHLIAELRPRSLARGGCGIWSATPQVASSQLFDLHDRATDPEEPDIIETHMHIKDNPHIPEVEKQEWYRGMTTEEREVRWEGKFLFSSFLCYPEFDRVAHAWNPDPNKTPAAWVPPFDWTCYFSVDPGTQICAVLFWAVAPRHVGNFNVVYDECYIEKCDAEKFGRSVGVKATGRVFEASVMDMQAGRRHDMGGGLRVEDQYRAALIKNGVQMRNGVGFVVGSTDEAAGRNSAHDFLRINADGRPRLFVVMERCPNFIREIERYRFAQDAQTKLPTDKPIKKHDHLMDALRYMAHFKPYWRMPKPPARNDDLAYRAFLKDKSRGRRRGQQTISLGLGSQ